MKRGFRDALASYVPWWLSNRPGLNVGYKFLYTAALILDCFVEATRQGIIAAWPSVGTPTADPYIAASRGLVQGMTETQTAFETRLTQWLAIYAAGSAQYPNRAALAQRVWEYVANNPRIALAYRNGNAWIVIAASTGVITEYAGVPIHWDDGGTFSIGGWSDMWIVVDNPPWPAETRTLSTIASTYGTFSAWAAVGWGVGMNVPREPIDAIQGLFPVWQGAHTNVVSIIWNYNAGDFNPASPSSIPTNGRWRAWAEMVSPSQAALPQRKASDRFWEVRIALPQ